MSDTTTVDLASWLTAVWDEEEAMVQAAIDDDTGQDGGFEDEFDRLTRGREIAGPLAFEPSFGEACARMIVHNTPRRALARIAADRKILELHAPFRLDTDQIVGCDTCSYRNDEEELQVAWPCPTLRALASPYAGREGFQEAWR